MFATTNSFSGVCNRYKNNKDCYEHVIKNVETKNSDTE